MEFQVLGRVAVLQEVVRPAGKLARTLLGVLLSQRDTPVPVDALIEALWPGVRHERAVQKLHVHVTRLRTAIGGRDRLLFEQDAYRLRVLPGEVDADRFETMADEAAEASESDPARCVEVTRKALTLWRGDPYPGIDTPLVADAADRLCERRQAALEMLFHAELVLGRHTAVLAEIAEFAKSHPLHEQAHWLYIAALYLNGRRAEATAAYRTVRSQLAEELAIEPGTQLRELNRQVIAEEPVALHGAR